MAENPQYVLKQDLKRAFIPQIFLMLFFGGLLFFGFKLNAYLLKLNIPSYLNYIIPILIIILISINLFLIYRRAVNTSYEFYTDRVELNDKSQKTMRLSEVSGISLKRNILDKTFNTASIILEPDFEIKNISNTNQVYFYIQKLVQYAKQRRPYS